MALRRAGMRVGQMADAKEFPLVGEMVAMSVELTADLRVIV